jgi:hypothetical protein
MTFVFVGKLELRLNLPKFIGVKYALDAEESEE